MLRILIVCAVISIAFGEGFANTNVEQGGDPNAYKTSWIEGAAIFAAVFVVSSVGSWNDYKKEEQFLKMQADSDA